MEELSDSGFCGKYTFVTDMQARVAAIVRVSSGEVVQASTYDSFGQLNRISAISGGDRNNPPTQFATISLPTGKKTVRIRANYVVSPSATVTVNGTTAFAATAVPRVNQFSTPVSLAAATTATIALGGATQTMPPSGTLPGTQFSELEYTRSSGTNAMSTPLRGPGQFYDPELDLFENWNRYYAPSMGRYLSPEPLLQSPAYVRRMAQTGMTVPTYAYAANNPLRYTDSNGLEVMNLSGSPLVIKVEIGNSYELLLPGDTYHGKQDAVYTENGEVYKTAGKADTPGGNVIVNPDGTVEVSSNPGGGLGETAWNELGPFSVGDHFLTKNDWLSREAAKRLIRNAKKGVCGGR